MLGSRTPVDASRAVDSCADGAASAPANTGCIGVSPLQAKWAAWMRETLQHPQWLTELVAAHGSPVHLHWPTQLSFNAGQLQSVADARGIDFQIYFARKANKCLSYVDEAMRAGLGVDTASANELRQCIERGVHGDRLVYTAAIKEPHGVDLAIAHGGLIVIDNFDEYELVLSRLRQFPAGQRAALALRLRGFQFSSGRHRSRFGVDIDGAVEMVRRTQEGQPRSAQLDWRCLHFHLDGCDAGERVAAIHQCLDLADYLRSLGVTIESIDMGGGLPVVYLESELQWKAFWDQLDRQRADRTVKSITPAGFDFGLLEREGRTVVLHHLYPYWQARGADDWLAAVLDGREGRTEPVAERLIRQGIELRCEPGRALVAGCGMTVATVCFRKQDPEGNLLVGLAMNRTQCRTTAADFCVDPELIPTGSGWRMPPSEGYFVGAYCMESEYLTPRKMRFPAGVAVDDLVIFPNTAGYQMHFLESRSHQFDLPANLVLPQDPSQRAHCRVDPIGAEPSRRW